MFDSFSLDRQLLLGLEQFSLDTPTKVQQQVIPQAIEGANLSICAPTGSGKTLAYLIPVCQRLLSFASRDRAPAIVLVPTRELARQVLAEARKLTDKSPLRAQALTGGADFRYQQSELRKDPDIIIATPGRLLDHLKRGSLADNTSSMLVLDEADKMLDMGFRDDVLALAQAFDAPQTLLLSATLAHRGVKVLAEELIDQAVKIDIGTPRAAHSQISHQVILADSQGHKDQLLLALATQDNDQRALVFTNKRVTTGRLAQMLIKAGIKADALHGEMSTEARKAVMSRFRGGSLKVLVASDLAARGIDVEAIDLVINYDMPSKADIYVHRTGRTGRASATGTAISLVAAADWDLLIRIERYLKEKLARRSLPGLKARYKGPKKTKSSGKAVGTKRKKSSNKTTAKAKTKKMHSEKTTRSNKPKPSNDGFAPLRKKPRP